MTWHRFSPYAWALCLFWLLVLPQCSAKENADFVDQGIRFTEEERYDEAITAFNKAIEKNPHNSKAYFGLGGIYNMRKDHARALELFQKAVREDPTYVDGYYGLGFTYELLGKKEEAEEAYKQYRELKRKLDGYIERDLRKEKKPS